MSLNASKSNYKLDLTGKKCKCYNGTMMVHYPICQKSNLLTKVFGDDISPTGNFTRLLIFTSIHEGSEKFYFQKEIFKSKFILRISKRSRKILQPKPGKASNTRQ